MQRRLAYLLDLATRLGKKYDQSYELGRNLW